MSSQRAPHYVAIGHVTIDLDPTTGSARLGGTALYAALTAARFGLDAAILTRGKFDTYGAAIQEELGRFSHEVAMIVQEAAAPTVFTNRTVAGRREQTVHSWAGPIDLSGLPPTWRSARIIHLALSPRRLIHGRLVVSALSSSARPRKGGCGSGHAPVVAFDWFLCACRMN